ncbi:MAG: alpha/beta hydrolase fold domain-containing protein [Lachnospiraceae bacterium]|nr:alpha/beta hydrolase fold domain-containing protein [Lachnospiraceae bacterium]
MDGATLYIKQLKPYLYLLDEEHQATGYLVIGENKAVLIDTMNGLTNLRAEVEKLTDKPVMVVNTHGHPDHVFGNVYFDEAYIHPKDVEMAQSFTKSEEYRRVFTDKGLFMPPFKPIQGGDVIDLGGKTLEVYDLPGHTAGGILLLLKEDRILFVGDGINHHLWMQLDSCMPISEYVKELDKVMFLEKEADVILHGHAQDYDDISLLRCVRNACAEIAEGKTAEDEPYPWFAGVGKKHRIPLMPGKHYQQSDSVICYDPENVLPEQPGEVPRRVTAMRKAWAAADAARDAGLTEPESVEAFRNISYGPHGEWNLLDVYRPKEKSGETLPVIVSIHGGGFFYGDKELYRFYTMHLAEMGFAVVNYNYRLAPENHFPAPLEDAMAVLDWISANATAYGLDTSNLFFVGDSAGAQLVSQFACILTNPAYAQLFEMKAPEGITVRAISLACGVYTLLPDEGGEFSPMMLDYLAEEARTDNPRLEVKNNITKDYPPTFIFSAYLDSLYEACEPMAEFLRTRGVEVRCKIYGSPEAEDVRHVFHVNMKLSEGERANRDQTAFFKEHIR